MVWIGNTRGLHSAIAYALYQSLLHGIEYGRNLILLFSYANPHLYIAVCGQYEAKRMDVLLLCEHLVGPSHQMSK